MKEFPEGLDRCEHRTLWGNRLMFVTLAILRVALRCGAVGWAEQPQTSRDQYLKAWQAFLRKAGVSETIAFSCGHWEGSP